MKRNEPPSDDPDPSGGGGDDDDDDLYHDAHPVAGANAPEGKVLGNLPSPFNGDRTRAEEFILNMQAYFRLNIRNSQIRSPMTRVAMCLSNMEGQEIEEWKGDVGRWFDTLNPDTDDRQGVWLTFLEEFEKRFDDSQKETTARTQLTRINMEWPRIDEYVSTFEKLARKAGYNHSNPEVIHYFMNGLPKSILADVLRSPTPTTYYKMKEKAIESVRSRVLIDAIIKGKPAKAQPPPTNWFQTRNQQQQQPQRGNNQPRFNSSTAPPSWNNRPVPMDLSRSRAPRPQWQRINAGQDGNQPQRKPRGPCFNCGKQGHFARDCRGGQPQTSANATWIGNIPAYQAPPGWTYTPPSPQLSPVQDDNPVEELQARVMALSPEDKGRLLQSYGVPTEETKQEDF
jgi:hypothetical protein